MRVLIVEDDCHSADFVEQLIIDNFKELEIVAKVTSVRDASKLCHTEQPDLIVMDIRLGEQLSFELFDYIDPSRLIVLFISTFEEYALKAIKLDAVDFIIKPVIIEDFKKAIIKAQERFKLNSKKVALDGENPKSIQSNSNFMLVWENDRLRPVDIESIVKIKSDGAYSKIYLNDEKRLVSSKNIGLYESLLKEKKFIRIHHSCLVNSDHIKYYKPGIRAFVTLSDSKIEYVSKGKKKELLRYFNNAKS